MYFLNLGVKGLSLPLYLHYTNITCDRHRIIEVSLKKWSMHISLQILGPLHLWMQCECTGTRCSAPVHPRPGVRATDILRETLSASRLPVPHQSLPDQESVPQIYSANLSAIRASLLRTSLSPTRNPCHRYTPWNSQRFSPPGSAPVPPRPVIRATNILRDALCAPRLAASHQSLPDQESVPQIYSVKARRSPPPCSAPVPPRPGIRATDILRESSALRATHRPVFRVFPL